ncbi:MAG: DUF6198 family protein [Lachnospiraceae bacterium]|nr:DUF6198 family protein [Lachnospiraceae bacterium]MDD3615060.1 DUF6198 family protein [Lachnospiraceae bacterium]
MKYIQLGSKKITAQRFLIYVCSLVILAFGITLNTKTQLGISPIISVAYNISYIGDFPLGIITFIYYTLMVILQIVLLGKDFEPFQILQIPMCFITSSFIQLFDIIVPVMETPVTKIIALIGAIVITGIGASLTVGMKIVPNPADGLASVFGLKFKKDFGFGKNFFDFVSIIISLAIGFIFTGGILGIGIGTVCSMIFTGRVIALLQKKTDALYQKVTPF